MYTRKQLSLRYSLSLATIRRLLLLLKILPTNVLISIKGLPTYYYDLLAISILLKHILEAARYKLSKKKTCTACHKKYTLLMMIGTRCIDCYVDKCCKPILFGKEPWKKIVNSKLVTKAMELLKSATRQDQ